MFRTLAWVTAAALTLVVASTSGAAGATAEPSMEGELHRLEREWARITFQLNDNDRQRNEMELLGRQADAIAARYPGRAEPLIWQGLIASSVARYAGAFGALSAANQARERFEKAARIDFRALDGAVPVGLGALYYLVPGFPLGFGDNARARHYLNQGVEISPDGLDSNYFLADFLYRQGEYARAAAALQRGLAAAPDFERPVWDAGRRKEMRALLAKVDQHLVSTR